MQKVKVQRYVAGKRPKYAPESDNEEELTEESDHEEEEEEEDQVSSTKRTNMPDPTLIKQNTGLNSVS
jgi:hypothetical protein